MHVPGTRYKRHLTRHEKILDEYEKFNTYVIVKSLGGNTTFGRSDVRGRVMTLEASILVSRLYHNNKEYGSIINPIFTLSM